MHDATARSCLIASPSFPLSVASGFLRAGSDAVDLTSIAPPADKDLRAAASTQKHSARCFVGRMRHTDPQPRRRFRLLQPPIRSSMPPCSKLSRRGLETSECASLAERRPTLTASARDGARNLRSGRKKACGAVEQKKGARRRLSAPGGRPRHRVTAPSLRGFRQPFTGRGSTADYRSNYRYRGSDQAPEIAKQKPGATR